MFYISLTQLITNIPGNMFMLQVQSYCKKWFKKKVYIWKSLKILNKNQTKIFAWAQGLFNYP